MTITTDDPVKKYLKQLDAELADLPRGRRREIVEEISEHIAEAQAQHPAQSEAEIRAMLERLGDPADIAAEARQRFDVPLARPGWQETVALVFLLVGGFIFFVGWFVGLVLLWTSSVWTVRDKLVGTLIVPGGLAFPVFLFSLSAGAQEGQTGLFGRETDPATGKSFETCTGGGGGGSIVPILFALGCFFVAPLITTAYLARRMRRRGELATV